MLESFRKRGLALKIETVEGTDAVPTAALDAFQLFDGSSGVTADRVERPVDRPFFGHDPFVNSNLRGFVEGGFEFVPPPGVLTSADKAAVDVLLRIAGMAKTFVAAVAGPPAVPAHLVYNPISESIASGTGYFWHAGVLYKVTGARANVTGLAMEIGSYLRGQCRIEGSCQEVPEAALPSNFDFSAFGTPAVNSTESMELLVNGFAVAGKALNLDFGNENQTIEHTEARLNRILDRRPTFTARFYRPARASLDPWALWKAGTIVPLVGTVVYPAGHSVELAIRGQIEEVRPTEIDGDYGYEVTGRCVPSDAGGDEFTLTCMGT